MAKAWRAICDYVFWYKKYWNSLEPLMASLRMNFDDLPRLNNKEVKLLDEYYQNKRMSRFLIDIKNDFDKYKKKGIV